MGHAIRDFLVEIMKDLSPVRSAYLQESQKFYASFNNYINFIGIIPRSDPAVKYFKDSLANTLITEAHSMSQQQEDAITMGEALTILCDTASATNSTYASKYHALGVSDETQKLKDQYDRMDSATQNFLEEDIRRKDITPFQMVANVCADRLNELQAASDFLHRMKVRRVSTVPTVRRTPK